MQIENIVRTGAEHSTEAFIESLPSLSKNGAQGAFRLIDAASDQAGGAYRLDQRAQFENAQAAKSNLAAFKQKVDERLAAAEQQLAQCLPNRGSVILMLFSALACIACIAAEFDISWVTIPWALGIKQYTLAATLLALAAAVSPIILKVPIAKLVWEPLSNSDHSNKTRRYAALIVFLLGVATLTIYTVAMLADARSAVSQIKELLAGGGDVSRIDRSVIDRAIYFVSISLAINGSLFFLIALEEKNKLVAYWRARCAVFHLRRRQRMLAQQLAQAESRLNVAQEARQHIEERAQQVVRHYCERLKLKLEPKLKPAPRSYREIVNDVLSASLN